MRTTRARRGFVGAAVLSLAAALLPGAGPAQAAGSGITVVDVVVTPSVDDLADGFATLTVDLTLTSTTPLQDVLTEGVMGESSVVGAAPVGGALPWLGTGESGPNGLGWGSLERVAGTPTDGTWRATTQVSPIWSGTWLVTDVADVGTDAPGDRIDVSGRGLRIDLGDGTPAWRAVPVPVPVRVVTGDETWVARARVTDRTTGAGVPAPWLDYYFYGEPTTGPRPSVPAGSRLQRADAQGYLSLAPSPVVFDDGEYSRDVIHVYGGRGSRGFSWEAATVLWPQVKWQANQRFSTSGRSVAVSGNAWPAPAVYSAVNPTIHLQQLVGRTWRTVASGQVRDNGRYSIAWTAPAAGPQVLRVYKPGGSERNGLITSVGSTLAAVTVTTR